MERRTFVKTVAAGSVMAFVGEPAVSAKVKGPGKQSTAVLPIDEIILQRGRVRCQVRFSYESEDYFDFVLAKVRSGKVIGLGEGITKDIDKIEVIAKQLISKDARLLDNLIPAQGGNTPRETLSMALYDLVAKAAGLPFNVLLGGAARKEVPLMPCIFPMNPADAGKKAKRFASMGFKSAKFKMVGDKKEDLDNLKAVRANMPADTLIVSDANKGYKNFDQLAALLVDFEKAGLNIFEDPLDGDFEQYKKLRGLSSVRIMIDAAARTEDAVGEVLSKGACDIINLHPNQQGGFSKAIMRANAAEIMHIPAWVGGSGYLGVGSAAYQHLASVIGLSMPCGELGGIYDHGFENDIIIEPLPMRNGAVLLPERAGLGVEIDEKALANLMIEERKLS